MNRRRWSLPLGCIKTARKKCALRCRQKELNVSEERIESGREFQIVGAAARKERGKMRLVRGACNRLEKEDDRRTQGGR